MGTFSCDRKKTLPPPMDQPGANPSYSTSVDPIDPSSKSGSPPPTTLARMLEGIRHTPHYMTQSGTHPSSSNPCPSTSADPINPSSPPLTETAGTLAEPSPLSKLLQFNFSACAPRLYTDNAKDFFEENKKFFEGHGIASIDEVDPEKNGVKKVTPALLKKLMTEFAATDEWEQAKAEQDREFEEDDNHERENEDDSDTEIDHRFDYIPTKGAKHDNLLQLNSGTLESKMGVERVRLDELRALAIKHKTDDQYSGARKTFERAEKGQLSVRAFCLPTHPCPLAMHDLMFFYFWWRTGRRDRRVQAGSGGN